MTIRQLLEKKKVKYTFCAGAAIMISVALAILVFKSAWEFFLKILVIMLPASLEWINAPKLLNLIGAYLLFSGFFLMLYCTGSGKSAYDKYIKTSGLKPATSLLIVAVLLLIAVRFIGLTSDFPPGLEWSRGLYTDEGWYLKNAAAYHSTGNWYIEGDLNPAVNWPVRPIVQALWFNVFGMSLTSARAMTVVFSVLLLLVSYLFIRKYENERIAALSVFLVLSNFMFFAYSRMAFLEIPMLFFIFTSALLIPNASKNSLVRLFASAIVFLLALLTKTLAIFALLPILYLIFHNGRTLKNGLKMFAAYICCIAAGYAAYNVYISSRYPWDYVMNARTVTKWLMPAVWIGLKHIADVIYGCHVIDYLLFPVGMLGLMVFVLYKKHVAFTFSTLCVLSYFFMFGLYHYAAPRFHVVMVIPLMAIIAVVFYESIERDRVSTALTLSLIVSAAVIFNCVETGKYLASPKWSFINMSRDVKKTIDHDTHSASEMVLLGMMSGTVGIETGLNSISNVSEPSTATEANEAFLVMKKYKALYYLSLGEFSKKMVLARYFNFVPLKQYDVLGNYSRGSPVYLYRLDKK